MTNLQINFTGWVLFVISAIGFCIASIGNFWAMLGSGFILLAGLVFIFPYSRSHK